jgi:acetate kinase
MPGERILVINTGSSSVKFGIYERPDEDEWLVIDGVAEGVGQGEGKIEIRDGGGRVLKSEGARFASDGEAMERAAAWLEELGEDRPAAIGHRVVHGGPRLLEHQKVTPRLIDELKACVHLAPLHVPVALESIARTQRLFTGVEQFACFDTAFHRHMPEAAARFALPSSLYDEGVRRYGFHGLSYESIVHELGASLPGRVVMAHLGGGSSVTAVKDGRSVDTTMAFTPTAGVPMATRSGDLDPGILLYLMRVKGLDADAIERLVNHDAGLSAVSGGRSDMRDLEHAAGTGDARAALAIDVFCRAVAKSIAGYAAVLGGLDLVVFAGGIGEHSAGVRRRVCAALGFLGVALDNAANRANAAVVSAQATTVAVRIVPSQEDRQIARHCRRLMG